MTQLVIDIRTLLLVSTIILFCRAALLVYAWTIDRSYRPIKYWAQGASLAAIGVLFLSLRGIVPLNLSVLLGNAGLIFGWMLISAGTITATERVPPWRWGYSISVLALLGAACFLLLWPDELRRALFLSLAGLLFDAYTIYACLRFVGGRWRTLSLRIIALLLSITTASSLLKNFYMIRLGSNSMFDSSAQNSQYYLLNIAVMLACTVLYILLAAQQSQEEMAKEVELRKHAEQTIRNLAYYDSLTQLPNRRMLTDRLDAAIAASKRSGMYFAVMMLDLDNFKLLNDEHGHAVGDLLLIEVARQLRTCVREVDTVSRIGGDEFVVVLAGLHVDELIAREQAVAVAEKLRAKLCEPSFMLSALKGSTEPSIKHRCSVSIGLALFCGEIDNQNELIRLADDAMYHAKRSGRNAIHTISATHQAYPLTESL
jgi:diguanylate cyclase (GGDEF)-like protein